MAKRSKRYRKAAERIDRARRYPLEEAIRTLVAEDGKAKFDETVELAVKLGVDPRQADQNVRGTVILPHGTGKSVRVLVFAKGDKAKEAQEAGADHVGAEDIAKKIQEEQWLDFDTAIATPDMMGVVGRLGKVLGPRGLMPNPKVAVLADYRGLTVVQMNRFRRAVREAEGRCRVTKNTLAKRAVSASRYEQLGPLLRGPMALILGFKDPVAIAKITVKFAEELPK